MHRARGSAVAVALTAIIAGGCGGAGGNSASVLQRGSAIFTHSCGGCHTLNGRESGADGGDLIAAHLSVADLESFTAVMPSRPPLSASDVHAVAEFVHAMAVRARHRAVRGRVVHAPAT